MVDRGVDGVRVNPRDPPDINEPVHRTCHMRLQFDSRRAEFADLPDIPSARGRKRLRDVRKGRRSGRPADIQCCLHAGAGDRDVSDIGCGRRHGEHAVGHDVRVLDRHIGSRTQAWFVVVSVGVGGHRRPAVERIQRGIEFDIDARRLRERAACRNRQAGEGCKKPASAINYVWTLFR